MRKAIKRTAVVLGGLFASLLFTLLFLLLCPQLLFNTRMLSAALKAFGGAYQPRWQSLSLAARAPSLLDKELSLKAGSFCFADRYGAVEGCLKEVDIRVALRLGRRPRLTRVERFTILGDHLALDPAKRPSADGKRAPAWTKPPQLPRLLPESLRALRLESLRVELPRNELRLGSGTLKADMELVLRPERARPLLFTARARRLSQRVKTEMAFDSDLFRNGELTYVDMQGALDAGAKGSAQVSARLEHVAPEQAMFLLRVNARASGRRLETGWTGFQDSEHYEAHGSASVFASTGPLRSAAARNCDVRAPFKKHSTYPESVDLRCAFRLEPGLLAGRRVKLKALEGTVSAQTRFGTGDLFQSHVEADIRPVRGWYELSAGLKGDISGSTSRLAQSPSIDYVVDAVFSVARFQDLVSILQGTALAVPAPFHVLDGPLTLRVQGRGDPREDLQQLDYALGTDLSSGKQKFKLGGKGRLSARRALRPKRALGASAEVVLTDIALELPRLEVTSMPKVTVDKRISLAGAAPDSGPPARPSALALDAAVHVGSAKPVILFTNLAKQPVPVEIDLDLLGPPARLSGSVTLQKFDVELFRRLATVERVALKFTPGSKLIDLDGLIHYKTADATINIVLLGSTDKPRVELSSDPPMDKGAIVSLLVFGKTPSELDSDQQASVGNAQNALATQAFGLASLYLFASTPIEYVGYDPASQSYAVKFRLPGGASLEVGSDFEESRHVRLRKRLSSRWAIQTEMRSQTDTGNAVETLLEWFQRY